MITFDDYNTRSSENCTYPDKGNFLGLVFCALKANGEAGEIAEKIGKCWRDKGGVFSLEESQDIAAEIGDVLWYLNRCAEELGIPLSTIARHNIDKVLSRRKRGTVAGSGDNR